MKRIFLGTILFLSSVFAIITYAATLPWGIEENVTNGFIVPMAGSKEVTTPEGCRKISGIGVTQAYFAPTKTTTEWNAFKAHLPAGISIGTCIVPINGSCNNSIPLGCFAGTATSDNGQTSCSTTRTWTCAGSGGGSSASCSKANSACVPITCPTTASFYVGGMDPYGLGSFNASYYPADPSKFILTFNRSGGDICTALGYGAFGEGNQSFILPRNGDIIGCSHGHGGGFIKVTPIDECHINIGRKFFNNQIIEICSTAACSYTYSWSTSSWGACSLPCGGGTQNRSVTCQRSDGVMVADSFCSGPKPSVSQSCNMGACSPIKCSPGAIVYQDNGCSAIDCKVYCASDGTHYFVSDNGANSGCAGTNYTDLSAANACAMDGYGGPTAPIPSAPGKWHITSYPFSLSGNPTGFFIFSSVVSGYPAGVRMGVFRASDYTGVACSNFGEERYVFVLYARGESPDFAGVIHCFWPGAPGL